MYETLALIELAVWLGLPAWIANSTPVIFGGGRPIDGGRCFVDGRRIFGDGKTIRGFIVGVSFGTLTGLVQWILAPLLRPLMEQYVLVTAEMEIVLFMTVPVAFAMSIGAMIGDLLGSFVKRRVSIKSGGPAPILDQVGFIVMALIVASSLVHPGHMYVVVLVAITLVVHWVSNALGYVMGYKQHPW